MIILVIKWLNCFFCFVVLLLYIIRVRVGRVFALTTPAKNGSNLSAPIGGENFARILIHVPYVNRSCFREVSDGCFTFKLADS